MFSGELGTMKTRAVYWWCFYSHSFSHASLLYMQRADRSHIMCNNTIWWIIDSRLLGDRRKMLLGQPLTHCSLSLSLTHTRAHKHISTIRSSNLPCLVYLYRVPSNGCHLILQLRGSTSCTHGHTHTRTIPSVFAIQPKYVTNVWRYICFVLSSFICRILFHCQC